MLPLLLLLDLTAATPRQCAVATVSQAVEAAVGHLKQHDAAAAKADLAPVAACPTTSYPAFAAHVFRAGLAVDEQDWPTAQAALAGVGIHPEVPLSGRAAFLRLRADQGVQDAAAFTRDREAVVAANDARLAAAGKRLETFRAGTATVTAYDAPVTQGAFSRVFEFVAVPDDPAAYPASIQLTDDRAAAAMNAQMAKPDQPKPVHVWFLDLYTCNQHSTLMLPAGTVATGPAPAYDAVKAQVVAVLATTRLVAEPPPAKGACFASAWLLPGIGGTLAPLRSDAPHP